MYVNRKEWGAAPTRGRVELTREKVEGVALHHPGMPHPIRTVEAACLALRSWQNDHMNNPDKKWSDIAYQLAFDQAGNVYQCRGMRYRSAANGDRDVNERFCALLLIIANNETPSSAMIKTVNSYLAKLDDYFPRFSKVVGHRDIRPEPTECPGDATMTLIHDGRFHV